MTAKIFFYVTAVFLLSVFVSAFDCSLTSDPEYCSAVTDEVLLGELLYDDHDFPDHDFISEYNLNIEVVDPPENTTIVQSRYVRDAWLSFLAVFPSLVENNTLFVPPSTNTLSEYDYNIQLPPDYYSPGYPQHDNGDCIRTYALTKNKPTLSILANNTLKGNEKYSGISLDSNSTLTSSLLIETTIRIDHYHWYTWCCVVKKGECKAWCHKCVFSYTENDQDNILIEESKDVSLYSKQPGMDLEVNNDYLDTIRGSFSVGNHSYFQLSFNNSYYKEQKYYYNVLFDKLPYYFITLQALPYESSSHKNLLVYNGSFAVSNSNNCSLFAYNHFYNASKDCNLDPIENESAEPLHKEGSASMSLLFQAIILIVIIYILYRLAKSKIKKAIPILLILLLFSPIVLADDPLEDEECGITNLATCIPEKLYDYFLMIINAPLLPMLWAVQNLLTAEVSTDIFFHVWSVVRYVLSFFYLFFFLYAGYIFLTSNADPVKRSQAKNMLKDTLIMIILIQGSFYIYSLILNIGSVMDNAILSMIDPHFFLLTMDNLANIGLEFVFVSTYAITLFLTLLMLVLRYIMVSFGVVLFPIGIFLYFIPPLKGYGKFIINMLGIFIFITFIDLLIILACSMLIEIPLFENFKILVMINCFGMVNYTLWLAIKFALKRSASMSIKDDLNQAVKYIALLA